MQAPRRVSAPVVLAVEAARELSHWPVAVQALHRRLLVVRFPALLPPPKHCPPGTRARSYFAEVTQDARSHAGGGGAPNL